MNTNQKPGDPAYQPGIDPSQRPGQEPGDTPEKQAPGQVPGKPGPDDIDPGRMPPEVPGNPGQPAEEPSNRVSPDGRASRVIRLKPSSLYLSPSCKPPRRCGAVCCWHGVLRVRQST